MGKDMEMVNIYGIMVNCLKGSGEMAKRMEKGLGNLQMVTFIKVYGKIIAKMVMGSIYMLPVQNIEVHSKIF